MPEAPPDQPKSGQQHRDGYDKANTFILALTLIAAGVAAFFTSQQASIARDQEYRALRAYVVVNAELKASPDESGSFVWLTAENMGQTPVYDLFFDTWNHVLGPYEQIDPRIERKAECRSLARPEWEQREGHTFSKTYTRGLGVSRTQQGEMALADLFKGDARVVAKGAVCYRDIFHEMHQVPVCYEWRYPKNRPSRCQEEEIGEEY